MRREKLIQREDQDESAIDPHWVIPCDVRLVRRGRRVTIQQGCQLRTLIAALKAREAQAEAT